MRYQLVERSLFIRLISHLGCGDRNPLVASLILLPLENCVKILLFMRVLAICSL